MPIATFTVTVEFNASADDEQDAVGQVREWLESHPREWPDYDVKRVD